MKRKIAAAALSASFAFGLSANATLIAEITSITYTGSNAEFTVGDYADEQDIINGSGLSAAVTLANIDTVTHTTSGSDNRWVTTAPNGGAGDFFAGGGAQGTVFFILHLMPLTV